MNFLSKSTKVPAKNQKTNKAPSLPEVPLVLVHGDDDFAVSQRARQVFQGWCEAVGGEDHETVEAHAANGGEASKILGRLRMALDTLPFFGGEKVVWFKDCNFLGDDRTSKTKDVTSGIADLTAWLKAFDWQGVRLLISAAKCDKRKVFYKAIAKQGHDEEFKALSIDDREWQAKAEQLVTAKLRKLGVKADYGAATELVQMVGPHTRALMSECEKVALYVGDRAEVTRDDVRAIVTPGKHAKAFALGDALGDRNLPRLLRRLDEDLWAAKTDRKKSTIGLCSGLISKVRALLFARELLDADMIRPANAYPQFKSQLDSLPAGEFPDDRRISPLGLHPYVLFNATRQANNYTSAELVRALDLLMQANLKLVSSSLDDSFILQSTITQIAARPAVAA